MSIAQWVPIIIASGHDLNHMADPTECPECRLLIEEHGAMPDHEELHAAVWQATRRPVVSKYSKVNIPDGVRWEIWERDNFTCQRCGVRRFLTIDHIHPEVLGGTLDPANLTTLCRSCNSSKGGRIDQAQP